MQSICSYGFWIGIKHNLCAFQWMGRSKDFDKRLVMQLYPVVEEAVQNWGGLFKFSRHVYMEKFTFLWRVGEKWGAPAPLAPYSAVYGISVIPSINTFFGLYAWTAQCKSMYISHSQQSIIIKSIYSQLVCIEEAIQLNPCKNMCYNK